ncbi:MAG: DUF748 domain-containing protein [Alcanivoracaceae bacterium]
MTFRTRWQQTSSRQRIAAVLALLWLLYVLGGYFVLSPVLRNVLVSSVADMTGREVVLERAVFNPAALSVSLRGFALRDDDGTDLLAFDEFYANFELSSLLRWSWHFDRISLYGPRVRVVQTGAEQFNFDDILTRLTAAPTEPEPANPASDLLPRFSFRELLLVQGDFRFRDQARAEPDELVLAPVSFRIADFSTRADGDGNNSFAFAVTGPAGGRLDWAGSVSFDPLRASGRLSLSAVDLTPFAEFFRDQVNFRVPSAMLDIATDYRFEVDPDGAMQLSDGRIVLSDLIIRDPALEQPVLEVPTLAFSGVQLDTVRSDVVIGEMLLERPALDLRIQHHGLHLESLFGPVTQPEAADQQSAATPEQTTDLPAGTTAGEPWQVTVHSLRVLDATVRVIDETLAPEAVLILAPVQVEIENLSTRESESWQLAATMTMAERGDLRVEGNGQLEPQAIALSLSLEGFPLAALEPWVRGSADVRVNDGALSAQLDVSIPATPEGAEQDLRLAGKVAVNGLAVAEPDGTPLLGFASLVLDGIDMALAQQSLSIATLTVSDLRAQSLIDPSGRDTVARIMPVTDSAVSTTQATTVATEDDWTIRIDAIRLRNGELVHMDRSLAPAFRLGLYRLDAEILRLDSRSQQPADISLSARIDQTSPLTVRGSISPLAATPAVDLTVVMSGYDMNVLTPFTGHYLGYAVSSGQLAVDSRIALQGSQLDSTSRVRAANFFLGDGVPSEEALRVPIKLGLAILRDQNGLIDLPVVAKGDLADPSVSVAGIILRAITNVLVKAATSPFSALAALTGGKEINHIDFVPGQAEPDDEGRSQIALLAQLLGERPTLVMNLSGSAQQQDRLPLAEHQLGRELAGDGWQELSSALDDAEFRRRLQSRYRDQTGERAESLLGSEVIADREQRDRVISERAFARLAAIAMQALPAEALAELAMARAQRSRAMLVEEFGLEGERLFIVSPKAGSDDGLSGVMLELGAN